MIRERKAIVRWLVTCIGLLLLAVLTGCGGGGSGSGGGGGQNPSPAIASLQPNKGDQGATVTLTITGQNTHFVQGTTVASLGSGIKIGNGVSGDFGSVTVNSATSATATAVIDATATTGARTLTVKTGTESVALAFAFTVNVPANQAPVANPGGPYTGLVGIAINFDGSGSTDPNNDTLTYDWDFGDNTAHGNSATLAHTYATGGAFTVTLTVNDGKGGTNSKTTTATINTPPVVNIGGPYAPVAGTEITFNGSATDADNDTLTFDWDFGDGTAHGSGAAPSHTYTNGGPLTVTLTVTDGKGGSDTKTANLTVDHPPLANTGGPYTGQINTPISFSGSATDADNDTLTYDWDFGDNTAHGSGATPSHTYASGGSFTVKLTVTDGKGGSDTKTTTASINRPPVAVAGGPYSALINTPVSLDGSQSSDPDGDPLTFDWNFGDGSAHGTTATPSHTYASGGAFQVTLTVSDNHGGSTTATTAVSVNRPPLAVAGGPYTAQLGSAIQFDGSASTDPDADPLTFDWDFGDNTTHGNIPNPSHTYAAGGTFTVTLTVSDPKGGVTTATISAKVNRPPVVNAGGPYTGEAGVDIAFTGSATDPDGDTLTYAWDFGDSTQGTGATPAHAYVNGGSYTASLTVTDGNGGSTTKLAQVSVTGASTNNPPVAGLTGPTAGAANSQLEFNASGSTDPDNDPLQFIWDFGDGNVGSGATVSHSFAADGNYTVKVTASDGKGGQDSKTLAVTIKSDFTPPVVQITSPAALKLFSQGTTDVSGTVSDPDDTNGLTVKVNGVDAVVANGQFTATNVPLREGNNTLTAVANDPVGNVATYSIAVTLDTTAPTISITSPTASATLMSNAIDISGNVNDAVPGTVNSGDVTVKINGFDAQVSNRSFSVTGISLVPGINTLSAVATDKAGNTSQTQIQVTLADTTEQQHIQILSGSGQTGVIGSVLSEPLVVQLLDANGVGIADRQITFTVSKSDGMLSVLGQQDQTVNVQSDQDGKASVLFQLGTRVGVGINQVTVTSPGASGEVTFNHSSTAGAAAAINIVGGSGQSGPIGEPLPLPFAVIVYDAGGNPLSGVPVTFTASAGGGNFGGNPTVTVNTDGDGKANAVLTLGQQEGINNNVVMANYQGNQSVGVSFIATGIVPGSAADTKVSGVTLDNAGTPVPGVTVTVVGTNLQSVTDDQGRFQITNAPVGTISLLVDGRTSVTTGYTFPFLNFQLTTIAGADNTLGGPIYLPQIDTDSSKIVGGDQDIVLTMKDVPGYQFTIFANSVTFPDGAKTGRMSLSQVHSDKVPMIPPNGSAPKYAGTLQPPGVIFNPPIKVQFPNTDGLAPGTVIDVYTYDHDLEQWVSQGPARVSADGAVIVSDAGFGITKSGWHFAPPPPPPKSCTASCKGDDCNSSTLQDPPCTCVTQPKNDGGACGGKPQGCQDQGICVSGICTGQYKKSGSGCDDGQFCTKNDKCYVLDECKGEPIQDENGSSEQVSFGFLNNIVQGIRAWKQLIPIGPEIPDASLSGSHAIIHSCCEDKKAIVDNDQYQLQASFPAYSTGDLTVTAPPWSGDYTITVLGRSIGVSYGVHGNFQAGLTAAISRTKDACKDNTCWGGSVGVQATFTGGLKGEVPNPGIEPTCGDLHNETCAIVKIFADFQTGLQFTGGVDCQKISANFDWSGLTLNLGVVVLDGTSFNFSFTKTFVLFQPQHIFTAEVPLPE